jgi:hypothetical protein
MEIQKQEKIRKCSNIKEYQKEYYLKKHKGELLTKIECSLCHKKVYLGNMPRHKKTQKHIKLTNELNILLNGNFKETDEIKQLNN